MLVVPRQRHGRRRRGERAINERRPPQVPGREVEPLHAQLPLAHVRAGQHRGPLWHDRVHALRVRRRLVLVLEA